MVVYRNYIIRIVDQLRLSFSADHIWLACPLCMRVGNRCNVSTVRTAFNDSCSNNNKGKLRPILLLNILFLSVKGMDLNSF